MPILPNIVLEFLITPELWTNNHPINLLRSFYEEDLAVPKIAPQKLYESV